MFDAARITAGDTNHHNLFVARIQPEQEALHKGHGGPGSNLQTTGNKALRQGSDILL
jgi:hypothetical protein